jgi:hypothetical protein
VVDEDAQAAPRPRAEPRHGVGERIDAGEGFDDHSFPAKVVAPDPFDEFGVLDALHPDPRLPGHQRPVRADRQRPARGPAGRTGLGERRAAQRHHDTVEQERAGPHREQPPAAVPVLQHHGSGLETDHRAAEAGVGVLDHHLRIGIDDRDLHLGRPRREHVEVVAPHDHRPYRCSGRGRRGRAD